MKNEPEKLLSIKEVAEWLDVTPRTVQSYATNPDPAMRLNGVLLGSWKFTRADVEDFLARRRAASQRREPAGV